MALDLLFGEARNNGSPTNLVFGGVNAAVDVTITALADVGGVDVLAFVAIAVEISAVAEVGGIDVEAAAVYDNRVTRYLAGLVRDTGWQVSVRRKADIGLQWQRAASFKPVFGAQWQPAVPLATTVTVGFQQGSKRQAGTTSVWELGSAVRRERSIPWQAGLPLRRGASSVWDTATAVRRNIEARVQKGVPARLLRTVAWSTGERRRVAVASPFRLDAKRVARALASGWEIARRPPPGASPWPPFVPPIYQGSGDLLFACPPIVGSPTILVFGATCEGAVEPGNPQFIIPLLRVYMSSHIVSCVLLPSMEPVQLGQDASVDADDDGFAWSLSATGPLHLLDQLAFVDGLPRQIMLTVDGFEWVFAIEGFTRDRAFPKSRVRIKGRSVTALLTDPYMPAANYLNAAPRTAQQLAVEALSGTGVALDWQVPDWLVPAGTWSFQGTPLSAVLRIAESVGAVVRTHRSDAQLTVAPRYVAMPWEWGSTMPDVQMPLAVVTTDSLDISTRPDYNAVYVSGQSNGVLGHVRRAGTAGDVLAPMVTDALITSAIAARQRGRSIIGAGGKQASLTMSMPVLTGGSMPGVLQPGQLLEVVEDGEGLRGLVRGVSLKVSLPAVRQTLQVERHL